MLKTRKTKRMLKTRKTKRMLKTRRTKRTLKTRRTKRTLAMTVSAGRLPTSPSRCRTTCTRFTTSSGSSSVGTWTGRSARR
jgi:hypothetical protein